MRHGLNATGVRNVWSVLVACLLVLLVTPTTIATTSTTIAAARQLPLGSTVTVQGTVTVPSGVFASGTFDQGFAIQDPTGGIYVSVATDLELPLRAKVRVTGQLAESFGLRILVPASQDGVERLGRGRRVRPEVVATAAVNEATEGRLVRVTGWVTQPVGNDLPYGHRLFIDDGSGELQVFVYVSTGIDLSGLQPGQRVCVTGFSGWYEDHAELNPRRPGDIRFSDGNAR